MRGARIILHSYPLVSDWNSSQYSIEFLTKSIKVGTEKCLLFGVCPKLTANNIQDDYGQRKRTNYRR